MKLPKGVTVKELSGGRKIYTIDVSHMSEKEANDTVERIYKKHGGKMLSEADMKKHLLLDKHNHP